jgi:hypothetical protein
MGVGMGVFFWGMGDAVGSAPHAAMKTENAISRKKTNTVLGITDPLFVLP